MAAVGTLVFVGRGIDLSLGSICALAGMVTALLIENYHWPWSAGISGGLVAGAVCGAVNGATVAWIGINAIITTIGTLSILRGLAFVLCDGQPILIESDALLDFGAGRLLSLPLSVWLLTVIFVVMNFVAYSTRNRPFDLCNRSKSTCGPGGRFECRRAPLPAVRRQRKWARNCETREWE